MTVTDPTDPDGMFTDPRFMNAPTRPDGLVSLSTVVTCTWCGCIVADTEVHQKMHATTLTTRRVE